jgi:hypothetical protein
MQEHESQTLARPQKITYLCLPGLPPANILHPSIRNKIRAFFSVASDVSNKVVSDAHITLPTSPFPPNRRSLPERRRVLEGPAGGTSYWHAVVIICEATNILVFEFFSRRAQLGGAYTCLNGRDKEKKGKRKSRWWGLPVEFISGSTCARSFVGPTAIAKVDLPKVNCGSTLLQLHFRTGAFDPHSKVN